MLFPILLFFYYRHLFCVLPPDYQEQYNSASVWDDMVLKVVEALRHGEPPRETYEDIKRSVFGSRPLLWGRI